MANVVLDLTPEEKRECIRRMYLDINYFSHQVLASTVTDRTPYFHREIYNYLEREDIRKLAIICPRGHAKSTLASKIYPLHQIAFGKRKFIIIISESLDQSINLLRDVKDELEYNHTFRYFFGDLVGHKWTETDIVTANGIRVWARGSRQRIRGSKFQNTRPDLIILDDFESELNTETPEQRDKLKKWINAAVIPAPDPKRGKIFLIGTIAHEDAYLSDIMNDNDGRLGWHRRIYKAGLPEKKPLWPERYSLEDLAAIRAQLDAQGYGHLYYQEYENEAVAPGTGLANNIVEDEHEYVWSEAQECWFIKENDGWVAAYAFLGLDPSRGTMRGDATGEVVIFRTASDKIYVVQANPLRLPTYELIDRIFTTVKDWHCRNLNIETIAFQEILRDMIYKYMPQKQQFFGINEYKPKDAKGVRLRGLSPYYFGGHIVHNGSFPELAHQLRSFPKAKHDDLLDALWYAVQGSYKPSEKNYDPNEDKKKKRKFIRTRRYNWAVL